VDQVIPGAHARQLQHAERDVVGRGDEGHLLHPLRGRGRRSAGERKEDGESAQHGREYGAALPIIGACPHPTTSSITTPAAALRETCSPCCTSAASSRPSSST